MKREKRPYVVGRNWVRVVFAVFCFCLCAVLTGCGGGKEQQTKPSNEQPTVQKTIGDLFLSSGLKIKATVTDNSCDPVREGIFELYVDANGNGSGMFGLGDNLCDIRAVANNLYLVVDNTYVVLIGDVTARMLWTGTQVAGVTNLADVGFSMVGSTPVSYSARQDAITITAQYASSTQSFEAYNLTANSTLSVKDAMGYVLDYYTEQHAEVDSAGSEEVDTADFYINSKYGVTIDGKVYSVGDTCSIDTYFGSVPEGILGSEAYREDQRVEFVHVSYLSETGRSVFTLTGNYVQSIETTADFEWLGITNGTSMKEIQRLLGYKLNSKEAEGFEPLDENVVVSAVKSNTIYCNVGQLNVELRCENSALSSIYIERKLAYK